MVDDPTPREIMLQLQAVVRDVGALTQRLDRLTETLASTYVPRGEYNEARRGDDRRFGEIESDVSRQSDFRRQVAAGFIVGFLLLIAGIVLSLARLPGVTS